MDLTERQKNILSLIVKAHIESGDPISSKAICEILGNISSATVRSEMSRLIEKGYLDQPHTSAGRVPTAKAYRMYVNGLLNTEADERTKKTIDEKIDLLKDNFESLSAKAGQLLSDVTGLPAVSVLTHSDTAFVKKLEVIPVGKSSVLLVLVTSDALARSRICNLGFVLNREMLYTFEKAAAQQIVGTELSSFNAPYIQSIAAKTGDIKLIPLFNAVYEIIHDILDLKLEVKGESRLLYDKNNNDALRLMEYISRRDAIISILASADDPISIVFGEEDKSQPTSVIVAKHSGGKIGVIGPARMSYESVIPSIAYFAKKLGEIITKAIDEME